jgi:serine/threonine protein kinase
MEVAVKVVHMSEENKKNYDVDSIHREIHFLQQCTHENIISYYGSISDDTTFIWVMNLHFTKEDVMIITLTIYH